MKLSRFFVQFSVLITLFSSSLAVAGFDPVDPDTRNAYNSFMQYMASQASEYSQGLRDKANTLAETFEKHAIKERDKNGKIRSYIPAAALNSQEGSELSSSVQREILDLAQYFYDYDLANTVEHLHTYKTTPTGAMLTGQAFGLGGILGMASAASMTSPEGVIATLVAGATTLLAYPGYLIAGSIRSDLKAGKIRKDPEFKKQVIAKEGPKLLQYSPGLAQFASYFVAAMERRGFQFHNPEITRKHIITAERYGDYKRDTQNYELVKEFIRESNWFVAGFKLEAFIRPIRKLAKIGEKAAKEFILNVSAISGGANASALCGLWLTK